MSSSMETFDTSMYNMDLKRSVTPRFTGNASHAISGKDRFIHTRSATEEAINYNTPYFSMDRAESTTSTEWKQHLAQGLGINSSGRVLDFKNSSFKQAYCDDFSPLTTIKARTTWAPAYDHSTYHRDVPTEPTKTLEAPGMGNDYYLNLLSWGSNNILAVALEEAVFLWNCNSGSVTELMSLPEDGDDIITSVAWMTGKGSNTSHIAVATSRNTVEIWDAARASKVRSMVGGHAARVGSMAWNGSILASGSRDTTIANHDVRVKNHHMATMRGHSQEVCGLAWSPDGRTLASGSNDNTVCLWDSAHSGSGLRRGEAASSAHVLAPRVTLTGHNSATKALAWSPHERNLLASGGGSGDNTIKLWSTTAINSTGALLKSVDTGSPVSSMLWNPNRSDELLSGHGFGSNQLKLWNHTPTALTPIANLDGHTERVLDLAVSPDGSTVASSGGDETLRFWDVFGEKQGDGPRKKKQTRQQEEQHSQYHHLQQWGSRHGSRRLAGGGDAVRYNWTFPRVETGPSVLGGGLAVR